MVGREHGLGITCATRDDKLGSAYLAMVKLACIRLGLRHYEDTT